MFSFSCLAEAAETKTERDARMKWFREAHFGMFIHWGLYSVPGGEYKDRKDLGEWFLLETKMPLSEYAKFAGHFNPVKFDAKEWVRLAKNAGMKYLVITTKHHDGFGMYPSKLTDWCLKSTPFQRDPLKELSDECQKEGIVFCVYYSIWDWHHPDYPARIPNNDLATGQPDMRRYVEFVKGQLKELITDYDPGLVWFDGQGSPWTPDQGAEVCAYVHTLKPNIVIKDNFGVARGGDYEVYENQIPASALMKGGDWETCMTMNQHWSYNKNDQNWKSLEYVVRGLADCAGKGGNLLLNVGPTSEGLIPGASSDRLNGIGAWTKANGESIYGTTASPFGELPWGRATQKEGRLFLHVFVWPNDGKLFLPLANQPVKVALLAAPDQALPSNSNDKGLTITLPAEAPDKIDSVIVIDLDGPATLLAADGSLLLAATTANIEGVASLQQTKSVKSIGGWTDKGVKISWDISVQTGVFNVALTYSCAPDCAGSEFDVTVGDQKVSGHIASTGSFDDFKTIALGEIKIAKSGPAVVTIKATKMPAGAVMNLCEIKLTPESK
ncbi:MAG: alpha-L-fucosidase [Verrucomicrobiaceae bacterium]